MENMRELWRQDNVAKQITPEDVKEYFIECSLGPGYKVALVPDKFWRPILEKVKRDADNC